MKKSITLEEKQISLGEKIYDNFVKSIGIVQRVRTPYTTTLQTIYLLSKFKNKRYVIHEMLEEYANNFETDRRFILRDGKLKEVIEYLEDPTDYNEYNRNDRDIKIPK